MNKKITENERLELKVLMKDLAKLFINKELNSN